MPRASTAFGCLGNYSLPPPAPNGGNSSSSSSSSSGSTSPSTSKSKTNRSGSSSTGYQEKEQQQQRRNSQHTTRNRSPLSSGSPYGSGPGTGGGGGGGSPSKKKGKSPSSSAKAKSALEGLKRSCAEKERKVGLLQAQVVRLRSQLGKVMSGVDGAETEKREHTIAPAARLVGDHGVGDLTSSDLSRTATMATAHALLQMGKGQPAAEDATDNDLPRHLIKMFSEPCAHASYLTSERFAYDLLEMCRKVAPILQQEARCLALQSPVYIFGDIHGNLEDLNFFGDNIWPCGISCTAGRFLFLGDYVDRGMSGLEVVAYLFSQKVLHPSKVFLLRGNHEIRDVNGWVAHYKEKSFLWQCQNRFGPGLGEVVWEGCNQVFDRMPLAAVIDRDIFCVHGGIPRPSHTAEEAAAVAVAQADEAARREKEARRRRPGGPSRMLRELESDSDDPHDDNAAASAEAVAEEATAAKPIPTLESRLEGILRVPCVASVCPPNEIETFASQQVASDCMWSDPAKEMQEKFLNELGFGESLRGGGAICFGEKAITDFLQQEQLSYIVRAHEAHAEGVSLSKSAKVFTIFSTSKDHGQGRGAMAGCILVDTSRMLVINRSTSYGNRYLRRQESVQRMSPSAIQRLVKIGMCPKGSWLLEAGVGLGGELEMEGGEDGRRFGEEGKDALLADEEEEEEEDDFEGYYDHCVEEEEEMPYGMEEEEEEAAAVAAAVEEALTGGGGGGGVAGAGKGQTSRGGQQKQRQKPLQPHAQNIPQSSAGGPSSSRGKKSGPIDMDAGDDHDYNSQSSSTGRRGSHNSNSYNSGGGRRGGKTARRHVDSDAGSEESWSD